MFKIETGENNPILRKIADKVTDNEFKKYLNLAKDMLKYIKDPDNGGIGLAAPQIGISKKIIVVNLLSDRDDEDFKFVIMINPEILEYSKETDIDTEGCLSLPNIKGEVERPTKIKLSFKDEKNSQKTIILEGLPARIVQHELDHLNGKLFIDYLK